MLERIADFASLLAPDEDSWATGALRAAETTGRPLGNEAFIEGLERLLGRKLARGRPGPAPKSMTSAEQPDLWG